MEHNYLIIFADGGALKINDVFIDSKSTPGVVRFINKKDETKIIVSSQAIKYVMEE